MRIILASMVGVSLSAACTTDAPSEPDTCFPVPAGAAVLIDMPNQGTTLQGDPGIMQNQGTELQGDPGVITQQGTTLQGDPGFMHQQGTGLQGSGIGGHQGTMLQGGPGYVGHQGTMLQGDPGYIGEQGTTLQGDPGFMHQQGTELQGSDFVNMQGTNLQGESGIMTQQGTTLQGDPGIMQNQGTTLQGESGVATQQGTTLQGDPGIMQNQGTTLQGVPGMQLQGTTLQGQRRPDMQNQGTTLQGQRRPDMQNQGTTLQGDPGLVQMQGTTLQGDPGFINNQGTTLQGASNIMQNQGTSLQGRAAAGMESQGTVLQGAVSGEEEQGRPLQGQRAYRGLADLNGARLVIAADASNAVTVRDGKLVARGFADTASLKGTVITATAPDGQTFRVEIAAVEVITGIERVELVVDFRPACQPGQHGVFVPGRWDAQAAHVADPAVVTYSCMDGVIAKCVDWGYAPWLTEPSVHATCTRLARADYCGTGTPWTMDGTVINVYDRLGIHSETSGDAMKFEAAWGPSGAICVARSRYEIHDAGRTVQPACFATLPRCGALDDAATAGAVLANRSKVTPIEACK